MPQEPGDEQQQRANNRAERRHPREGPEFITLTRNPATLLGGVMALLGLAALTFALGVQALGVRPSPYFGIMAYFQLPAVMVAGLLLVPAGMLWEGRRRAAAARRGEGPTPAFRLDMSNPRHLWGIVGFSAATAVILGLLGATGYRTVEFTDSVTFCGQTCHSVMEPQYQPNKLSAHARVECTTCHIGPGASWWVQSKLSGVGQVVATILKTYPQPIPAPIDNLRPARETCEKCHWRERAYGLRLKVYAGYLSDEANTPRPRALAFRVGTGGGAEPGGVHWHTAVKIWYRAADEARQKIGWVRVEGGPDGPEEWVNPAIRQEDLGETRLMDCVDCHNRSGHDIPSPEELVDDALAAGRLDPSLPYLKREALRLLFAGNPAPDAERLAITWTDDWFGSLRAFYEQNYPDVSVAKAQDIDRSIEELKRISKQVIYPEMKTSWRTYINNNGHVSLEGQDDGCFRCHATLVRANTKDVLPSSDCEYCHYELSPAEMERLEIEPAP